MAVPAAGGRGGTRRLESLLSFCRGNTPAAPRGSLKVNLHPGSGLGAYLVSERCCHGGRKKLKNSWFLSCQCENRF